MGSFGICWSSMMTFASDVVSRSWSTSESTSAARAVGKHSKMNTSRRMYIRAESRELYKKIVVLG